MTRQESTHISVRDSRQPCGNDRRHVAIGSALVLTALFSTPASASVFDSDACIIEGLHAAAGTFGSLYASDVHGFYLDPNLPSSQALFREQTTASGLTDRDHHCLSSGQLEEVTSHSVTYEAAGDTRYDYSEHNFKRCQIDLAFIDGSARSDSTTFEDPSLGNDAVGWSHATYDVRSRSGSVEQKLKGSFGTDFYEFHDADEAQTIYSYHDTTYSDVMLERSVDGFPSVTIDRATGAYRAYDEFYTLDRQEFSGSLRLDGCYQRDAAGNVTGHIPTRVRQMVHATFDYNPARDRVAHGRIRFEADDGSVAWVRSTSDPSQAEIDVREGGGSTSRTVPWSRLLP